MTIGPLALAGRYSPLVLEAEAAGPPRGNCGHDLAAQQRKLALQAVNHAHAPWEPPRF